MSLLDALSATVDALKEGLTSAGIVASGSVDVVSVRFIFLGCPSTVTYRYIRSLRSKRRRPPLRSHPPKRIPRPRLRRPQLS